MVPPPSESRPSPDGGVTLCPIGPGRRARRGRSRAWRTYVRTTPPPQFYSNRGGRSGWGGCRGEGEKAARARPTARTRGQLESPRPVHPVRGGARCAPGPARRRRLRVRGAAAWRAALTAVLVPPPSAPSGTAVRVKRIHVTTGSSVRGDGEGEERRREPFGW